MLCMLILYLSGGIYSLTFHGNFFFTLRVFVRKKIAWEEIAEEIFFVFYFYVWPGARTLALCLISLLTPLIKSVNDRFLRNFVVISFNLRVFVKNLLRAIHRRNIFFIFRFVAESKIHVAIHLIFISLPTAARHWHISAEEIICCQGQRESLLCGDTHAI